MSKKLRDKAKKLRLKAIRGPLCYLMSTTKVLLRFKPHN